MQPNFRLGSSTLAVVLCSIVVGWVAGCSNDTGSSTPPSYALGGSVSGLTASGLVLTNGDQTLDIDAGANSFSFGTVLSPGNSYAVSVQTQPAGETCSVTGGSGTAGTANVANVTVVCSELSHSLGGTVSGLVSTGLVLANGDQTVSVPASATEFSFPTLVAQGSSYAVTVKTQPSGLACAVSKGTGTMGAANVTSVVVSCTDQPFNLGGTVSGLTSGELVLANGTDTLTVPSNYTGSATPFVMPAQVAYDSPYAITVKTQPTGDACTVTNGSGSMPAADVTNVSVVCANASYLLSGTISGLTASGLQLQLNGGEILTPASGSTTFQFTTPVAYDSPYTVTVLAQPTNLTCTVINPIGTMLGSSVTVAVTCAVSAVTVGGTIQGLTATGLVLANGTDTVSPAAHATSFSMPAAVAVGATYNVIVNTQPAGQVCSVTNGSGTAGTTDISVQVTCEGLSYTTAGSYTWTVPDGVTSIQIVTTGGGGGGNESSGAAGGQVTATITVTPNSTLTLEVGGGGGFGGGGGGASGVGAADGSTIIIAGGGGGAGAGTNSPGQAGGCTAGPSYGGGCGVSGQGGAGGSESSGNSGRAGGTYSSNPPTDLGGAGGSGASGAGGTGQSGGLGGGGAGASPFGGGGGGGWGGGGGGAGGVSYGGGGGGGGNYYYQCTGAPSSSCAAGVQVGTGTNGGNDAGNGGDGSIVITLNP